MTVEAGNLVGTDVAPPQSQTYLDYRTIAWITTIGLVICSPIGLSDHLHRKTFGLWIYRTKESNFRTIDYQNQEITFDTQLCWLKCLDLQKKSISPQGTYIEYRAHSPGGEGWGWGVNIIYFERRQTLDWPPTVLYIV